MLGLRGLSFFLLICSSCFVSNAKYITEEVGDSFILTYDDRYTENVGWQDAVKRAMTTWDNAILNTPSRRVVMYAQWTDSDLPDSAIASSAPIFDWDDDGDSIVHSKAERIWKNRKAEGLSLFNSGTEMDFTIKFNSTLTFDVTSNRENLINYDLESIALHEIGHNLGFFSSAVLNDGESSALFLSKEGNFSRKTTFDTLIHHAFDTAVINSFRPGESLYVGKGDIYKVYNPRNWEPDSSISHIEENDDLYPDLVMGKKDFFEETVRSLSVVELDLLEQMGWDVIPEASSSFLTICGMLGFLLQRRRRV